jgi:hypothetical protein
MGHIVWLRRYDQHVVHQRNFAIVQSTRSRGTNKPLDLLQRRRIDVRCGDTAHAARIDERLEHRCAHLTDTDDAHRRSRRRSSSG